MASNLPPSATGGFGRQELPLEPFPEESGDHSIKPAEEEKIHGVNDTPDESYEYDWDCESGVSHVLPFDMYKVYVGPLPYYVDSETLGKLFQGAGTVEVAKVVRNFRTYERTGQSIGLGYVKYTNARDATKAMKMFNEYDWDGRIIRAFKDAPNVIYVGNLSSTVDDDRLHKFFGEHGEVLNARVMYNEGTRQSLGYGFVVMAPGVSEMNAAIVELDGQSLDGKAVAVHFSEESPQWRHFMYYEKELATDEALRKTYNRWQRHFNIKRSEEDREKRFYIFKDNAHGVEFSKLVDMTRIRRSGFPKVLGMFADLQPREPRTHCGEVVDLSFRDDEGWSPVKKMSDAELLEKLIKEKGWGKKEDDASGRENKRQRPSEFLPLMYHAFG